MPKAQATTPGILYIVPTPIGNSEDITCRAIRILQTVDAILAEDTRHSLPFLKGLGIDKPLYALHAFNEQVKSAVLVQKLLAGQSLALISDAGTPLICDPGFPLVKQAIAAQIAIVPLPGACALVTALSAAGIACDSFTFGGFLPAKQAARIATLQSFNRNPEQTLIFYESTHRIVATMEDMHVVFGVETELVLAKELTKTFERFVRGNALEVKTWLLSKAEHSKGEFVILVSPRTIQPAQTELMRTLAILLDALPLKEAVRVTALLTGEPKNVVYKLALAQQNG